MLLIFISPIANAKVRIIDIQKTLAEAKFIQTIVVYGYTDTTLLYGPLGTRDTLSIECKIRSTSEQFRLDLINAKTMLESDFAGKWPAKGDTVLIVSSDKRRVNLFAKKILHQYRFWDPNNIPYSNSFFIFPKIKPFQVLPICLQIINNESDYWSCTDGCLIDCIAIKEIA